MALRAAGLLLLTAGAVCVMMLAQGAAGGLDAHLHEGHHHRGHVAFWEVLMTRPWGLHEQSCTDVGGVCNNDGADDTCCSGSCNGANDQCCQPSGLSIPTLGDTACCSGKSASGNCCSGNNTACSGSVSGECCSPLSCLSNKCSICFAGSTLVHTLEHPDGPIPIAHLQTGQHVLCLDTNDDMRLPTKTKWCKVHAWLHAGRDAVAQIRIHLADNSQGSSQALPAYQASSNSNLTVTTHHLVMRLTAPRLAQGATVASVQEFGRFETVKASDIKAGDNMAVLADKGNPAAGFTAVHVASVESVKTAGFYTPAIDSPFIIADGVVAPVRKPITALVAAPAGMDGAVQAIQQYLSAPVYTQTTRHPAGVAGNQAQAKGLDSLAWTAALEAALEPFVKAGKALSFEAVRDWWLPRHAAFQANPSKAAVSVEDVLALVQSDAAWLQPATKPHKEQQVVEVHKA